METILVVNGDRVIMGKGYVVLSAGECMRQRIELSLRLDLESWFLDPEAGIDWFGIYNQKIVSDRLIRTKCERVLLNDPEVVEISSIDITYDNALRTIKVAFKVESAYGTIEGSI